MSKPGNEELAKHIEEIRAQINEIEESTRFNARAIKLLKKELLDTERKLTGKPAIRTSARWDSQTENPADKERTNASKAIQKSFNSMSLEERQKFLDNLRR